MSGVIKREPVLLELHVAHHRRKNRPRRVRQSRAAKSGMKFVGDRRATDLRAAFEHERLVSRLGQIECGDQPVVAAADDDYVALSFVPAMATPLP